MMQIYHFKQQKKRAMINTLSETMTQINNQYSNRVCGEPQWLTILIP